MTDDPGPASEAPPSERGKDGAETWLAGDDGAPSPGQPLELRFTGSSSEYFRIWITNLCLTLLTFGVFSAWAKVRKKRYLYSNTLLDGSPFEYLGRPIPILKGRIVAALLFAVWFVVTSLYGRFEWFVLGPAFIVLPWLIVQSVSFNARNSAFRNMTFDFRGSYMDALRMLAGTALITVGTFGLGFGALHHRLNRFFVQNLRFGGARGAFYAKGAPYGDLDEFRGAPRAASSAVAAETVELFELDISL